MSILSSITTGPQVKPPRVLIYGGHGVGKTTFAAGARAPIVIQTEDGCGSLDVARTPLATSIKEVSDYLESLAAEKHDYKTVIVDSLDHLEPLVWDFVCQRDGKKSIEEYGYGKGYVEAALVWRKLFDMLTKCRDAGMSVVLIAHAEVRTFQDPSSEPYDRWQPKLHKTASAIAQEWADAVLFATMEKTVKRGERANRAVGDGTRMIYTEERPSHYAKNRYPGMPAELPLQWAEFAKHLAPKKGA